MRRSALVIGIDSYPDSPLLGCVADAEEIATALTFPQYGFDVKSLLDRRATRANVLQSLGEIIYTDESPGDVFLLYFAGHGAVVASSGHLVTADASQYDPGIPLATVAHYMEAASASFKHVIAILDCCHSGAAFTWTQVRPLVNADIDRQLPSVNESRCILAACGADESAMESGGTEPRGYFTKALVTGLLGDAVNFEGDVTLFGLHEYVARAIPPEVQTPVFKGDVSGTVALGHGFEPRKGAPIADSEKRSIVAKAQGFVDDYYQTQVRELGDREYRAQEGSRHCAKKLEPIVDWFEEKQQSLPELARDADWGKLRSEVREFQKRLTEISEGDQLLHGKVLRRIGQGGYGQVWEVERDGVRRAFKVFHGNELQDQVKVARFRTGFTNMKRLEHPHIVSVSELSLAPFGFLMDMVDGDDLRGSYIERSEPESVTRLLIDIAETVAHAHGHGVRHRDIKPENIIVVPDESGRLIPFLTDFDLAYHETNRTITTNLGVGGVINYAAPEQLYEPNAIQAREDTVDVFSLAQLMFFVLVGKDPSGENHEKNLATLVVSVRDWIDDRAAGILVELYRESTSRAPADRPQSMTEVITRLAKAEGYIQMASGTDSIAEIDFCRRIAYMYAGLGRFEHTNESASMTSLSGSVGIALRLRGMEHGWKFDVEIELWVTEKLPVPSFKSGVYARSAVNNRLDKLLGRIPGS
ncbi:MAG: serine/threonine protein kinase, partial [Rhodoglobus sp.]|nr:serine/threonine protein kinase [Rhodoglobus sp.]